MLDFITWNVNPSIIDSFVNIRWYGLMFAIGFCLGYTIVAKMFKHEGAPERWLGPLLIYIILGTVIGARLGHCLFYEPSYYLAHPGEILKIWEGGLASHGGAIGVLLGLWAFSHFTAKRSMLWTLDRVVVPIALVGALIRIGNLMNHEIYGHQTNMPWGFRFITNINQIGSPDFTPIYSAPSHPTQIYEALAYLLIFGILMWMYWKRNEEERPGLIFGVFLTLLFSARILIEGIKNNQEAFEANMLLNMGQLLSIPFVIVGIFFWIRAMRRPRKHIDFPNEFPDRPNSASSDKKSKK